MSGWRRRQTSGEVINATLLEVFLALAFMVFALAVFEKQRRLAAEDALSRAPSAGAVDAMRDSLAAAAHLARARGDSLTQARHTIDSLLFQSPYPPDCEPDARPEEILTARLTGPGRLVVIAHRRVFGLVPGETLELSPEGFRARFAAALAYSQRNGCRYKVRIEDTPGMPKAGYKEAMAAITSVFRFRNAFR